MMLRDAWNTMRMRRWLRRHAQFPEDTYLAGLPSIEADASQLRIGNRLHLSSRPVASHLAAGPGAILEIGNDVSIGCGAAIAAFQHVRIGDDTRIGPFVIIMDTHFHGNSNGQSLEHDCRPVMIGAGCRIGTRVTITRGVTIGDGAEVLAGSVVSSTVPPGVCVAGARARIIGKAGDSRSRWDSRAAALPELLMSSLELASPPDLDDSPISEQVRVSNLWEAMLTALEDRFGVSLDRAACSAFGSYADIAAFMERCQNARPANAS